MWIGDDFAHRTGLIEYYSNLKRKELKLKTSREHHFFDLTSIPISLGLEATDKNAAAQSIELRYPFLDRRVIEFCLALPPEQRLHNGFTRAIERESLARYLPPEIRQRTSKASAGPYIKYSLVKFEGIRMKDYLFCHSDLIGSYINMDFIQKTYLKLMAGTGGNLISLWYTMMLTFWLHEENLIELNTKNNENH